MNTKFSAEDIIALTNDEKIHASPEQILDFLHEVHTARKKADLKKSQQKYYAKDPEKWKEYRRQYYLEHKEEIIKRNSEYAKQKRLEKKGI